MTSGIIYHPGPFSSPSPDRPYELVSVSELLAPGKPVEFLIDGLFETGANIGWVGPPESGKSLLAQHVLGHITSNTDFHGRRVKHGLGVYLGGEGQAGYARRFQAIDLRFKMNLKAAPLVVAKCATSLLDPSEVSRVSAAIKVAEKRFGLPLTLLVVDTLARFIAPGNENATPDMSAYMAAVDSLRGDAAAISLHHPGHGDASRGRGSSAWKGALDAEFTVSKAGDILTLGCLKMKDGERPDDLSFRLETAPTLSAREDGSPISSVVLVPTDAGTVRPALTGKAQKGLLAELERLTETESSPVWTEGELREIARGLGFHKNTARDAVLGLRQHGYLEATVGGSRLAHSPAEGTKARNRDESTDSSRDFRDENARVSLRHVLSSRSSVPSDDAADGVAL